MLPKVYRGIHIPELDFTVPAEEVSRLDSKLQANVSTLSLRQSRKLTNDNKNQYIKLREATVAGLPYSAKLLCGNEFWKLHGEGCLVTIGTNYVAQVSINSIPDLEDANDFESAKELLLSNLKIDNVLFDQLSKETGNMPDTIKTLLDDLADQSATDISCAKSLLELCSIAEQCNYKMNADFAERLCTNAFLKHSKLAVAIRQYAENYHTLKERNLFQKCKNWLKSIKSNNFLENSLKAILLNHKATVLKVCKNRIKTSIVELDPRHFLLLRPDDLKLFGDLELALDDEVLSDALYKIEEKFVKRFTSIKPQDYCQSLPLIDSAYFHICKSMIEMKNRIEKEIRDQNILSYEDEWKTIEIDSSGVSSKPVKCFLKQLQVLVDVANHFEPGKSTVKENFPYKFRLNIFNSTRVIRNGLHIWLCLVDATVVNILQDSIAQLEVFSAILEMFHNCISSQESRVESVRMIAHNTLEFILQVEQSGINENVTDTEIFQKQMAFFGPYFLNGNAELSQYRDIMDVFKNYWERCNEVLPKLATKLEGSHLQCQLDELRNRLTNILSHVMQKNVEPDDLTKFFRVFNDLLTDIEDMPFEWFVRISNVEDRNTMLLNSVISRVNTNGCYQVQKGAFDTFVSACHPDNIPKHYQVEVMKTLLAYVHGIAQKESWENGETLSTKEQVDITMHLINAVRSSLLYLKEQPSYIDFEQYYKETVQPFCNVIDESDSLENFTKRVETIKESFWYIRNQNAIGIDKALQLFAPVNDNANTDILKTAYQRYDKQFLNYITEFGSLKDFEKIERIVQDVRNKVKPMHNTQWSGEFKQTVLPEIVAGLGAVWSIQVSRDVASGGKRLAPHSLQIVSILRLLGVDKNSEGVQKHLAQILTGQGKSVILGLTAATLALFGHEIEVVCYSLYLAHRDAKDFKNLFETFCVQSKISYKSFDQIAMRKLQNLYSKATKYLSKCIGIRFEDQAIQRVNDNFNNTVLLIDEVDVFFKDNFYGSSYCPLFQPTIAGLGRLQRKIWECVLAGDTDIENTITTFINYSNVPNINKLKSIVVQKKRYKMLNVDEDRKLTEVLHTNQSLFWEHLRDMIATAGAVHELEPNDAWMREFRLNSDGNITHLNPMGEFRTSVISGYWNTFIYFKLRRDNFVQTCNGRNNFGYLNLETVHFSYSKIPEKYPLILGVTGTLKGMSTYEKDAIENHYNIKQISIIPSFFGGSKLKFDQNEDFKCLPNEYQWRNTIFTRVNTIIAAQRAVIVFFTNETEIENFRMEFHSQLDRLNEISVNTEPATRDRYIEEAGLSRTVTLATREMGRGVDYKSSLSVEKNGGVHVIQTFFSLDEREETQIKGRTARKDNQGSYELIVCEPHLVQDGLIKYADYSRDYAYYSSCRSRLSHTKMNKIHSKLLTANLQHELSTKFYENH